MNFDYRNTFMRPLVDLFAIAEANVLADIIQYLNDNGIDYSPSAVSDDIIEAIEHVHMSGEMHNFVSNNLDTFLEVDPKLKVGNVLCCLRYRLRTVELTRVQILLERFRDEGKELFLLTNSGFDYVDTGLSYILDKNWRDVRSPCAHGFSSACGCAATDRWRWLWCVAEQLFDYVMVKAEKPKFYTRHRPFRELEPANERVLWNPVKSLHKHKVYVQVRSRARCSGPLLLALNSGTGAGICG